MRKSPTRMEPDYGVEFLRLEVDAEGLSGPRHGAPSGERRRALDPREIRRGCDGARSLVRQSIGGEPRGDYANHAWGVMDMLAVTDFPDIRLKARSSRRTKETSC
jgi:phenol 2-monooxygenase